MTAEPPAQLLNTRSTHKPHLVALACSRVNTQLGSTAMVWPSSLLGWKGAAVSWHQARMSSRSAIFGSADAPAAVIFVIDLAQAAR